MKNALSWTLIFMLGGVKFEPSSSQLIPPPRSRETIFLTPYIKDKSLIEQARNASKVDLFEEMANVTAYSGFITVDSTCNSSLFFLFVVSKNNKTDDPLMLWTQGGPGLSALFGELLENGPIAFDTAKYLSIRNKTLQEIANIIYLDLPVGAGFSFTNDNPMCYSRSLNDITDHVMKFLNQFLDIFPEYICRPFYLAGESYAARYSVAIANRMLNSSDGKQLLLKGVIGGNGFLGPILYLADSSDFMYQVSMVDEKGRDAFSAQFQKLRNMSLNNASVIEIVTELSRTLFTNDTSPTLYQNVTLYNDYLSPLLTKRSQSLMACFYILNISVVRYHLHIGDSVPFQYNNSYMLESLAADYLTDISDMVSNVLNKTNVLLYTGQLDPLFPSVNQRNYLLNLTWKEADAYKNATRFPWKRTNDSYDFAGFLTKTSNFTYAVMLGMSHNGAADKPDEVYYLMKEFMTNTSGAVDRTS